MSGWDSSGTVAKDPSPGHESARLVGTQPAATHRASWPSDRRSPRGSGRCRASRQRCTPPSGPLPRGLGTASHVSSSRSWLAAGRDRQAGGDPVAVRPGIQDRVGQAGDAHRQRRVAGRHAAAAGDDHLPVRRTQVHEPRGQLVGRLAAARRRPRSPRSAPRWRPGCGPAAGRPAPPHPGSAHRRGRPAASAPRSAPAAPPARWSAARWSRATRSTSSATRHRTRPGLQRLSRSAPRGDATVEHPHRPMSEGVEHPPQPGRRHPGAIVVGDHRGVRPDAQLGHPAREGHRVGQRMATPAR